MSTALAIGTVLAVGALAVVLYPLFFPPAEPEEAVGRPTVASGDDPVEAALRAFRAAHPECPRCGPRPERDAVYCSTCGQPVARGAAGTG